MINHLTRYFYTYKIDYGIDHEITKHNYSKHKNNENHFEVVTSLSIIVCYVKNNCTLLNWNIRQKRWKYVYFQEMTFFLLVNSNIYLMSKIYLIVIMVNETKIKKKKEDCYKKTLLNDFLFYEINGSSFNVFQNSLYRSVMCILCFFFIITIFKFHDSWYI